MVDLQKKMKDAINYNDRYKLKEIYKIRHKKERKGLYVFADGFEDAERRAGFRVGEAYFGGAWVNPYYKQYVGGITHMPEKEIREACQARIPEEIIAKMSGGLELSEREKSIVRKHGKVYVPAFRKAGILFRPQIRDLPYKRGKSPKYLR